jgi:hypothetical protein
MVRQLVVDWMHVFPLVLIPGALVGALLTKVRGYLAVLLAIGITTEVLTSLPAFWDFVWLGRALVRDLSDSGWNAEVVEGLLLAHVYLFVPILVAICIGYLGWGFVRSRASSRIASQTD